MEVSLVEFLVLFQPVPLGTRPLSHLRDADGENSNWISSAFFDMARPTSVAWRPTGLGGFNGHFRILNWRYLLPTIYKAYIRESLQKIWPYMVQYLHFRILKFPLMDSALKETRPSGNDYSVVMTHIVN